MNKGIYWGRYMSIYIFIDLQCCINIRYPAGVLHIYMCICILFHVILPCGLSQRAFFGRMFLFVHDCALWARWVSVAVRWLSLVAARAGAAPHHPWRASHGGGSSRYKAQLWHAGSVAAGSRLQSAG